MSFGLINGTVAVPFLLEQETLPGVKLVADKVREDIRLVSGKMPREEVFWRDEKVKWKLPSGRVFVATIGHSPLLDFYEQEGKIDLSKIRGKREVYTLQVINEGKKDVLCIVGSDKRGTIYGLFHLSESIGVSPFVYFADVMPEKNKNPEVKDKDLITSKEPSVKYRGFFINDEWPSFGRWTTEKFGGFTAMMYDRVFELLLRLKGNYLWPAMWSSSFPLDGPGLSSAELADTYGIVMGTSHHEPCLRASEEWDKVKGDKSPYGSQWNYVKNREGLLRYWKDGLDRSGKFENIITIGMRGERDSSMLGSEASLSENIDLLKEIISEQRKMIQETCKEAAEAPQMLALYKEVESYYYGDEKTQGLKEWDGLDGVTLMLCEDNFGNMRTLPTKEMRTRNGGFGMYYHFDYHGGPVSYEWVNSTPIEKIREQMSEAYEYGVRDIWVVNVGDLKPQEYPLSFFMKLAYDYDAYKLSADSPTETFTKQFTDEMFHSFFNLKEKEDIVYILKEYTRLNGIRRPEVMRADVFHPEHYCETDRYIKRAKRLKDTASALYLDCPQEIKNAFFELVYFPAAASANLVLMQLAATKNRLYAKHGLTVANRYADEIVRAIEKDSSLTEEYHKLADGKWKGMMSSAHIGFNRWNDEGWTFPDIRLVQGVTGSRAAVQREGDNQISFGGTLKISVACTGGEIMFRLLNGGTESVNYEIVTEGGCFVEEKRGDYEYSAQLPVHVTAGEAGEAGKVYLHAGKQNFTFIFQRVVTRLTRVVLENCSERFRAEVQETGEYAAFEAGDFVESKAGGGVEYQLLTNYGRTKDSVKAFPVTISISEEMAMKHETAEITYAVNAEKEGNYNICLYVSPTNPLYPEDRQKLALTVNDAETQIVSTLPEGFLAGNCTNSAWNRNVLDNIRKVNRMIILKKGENRITVGAVDAGVMLQKLVIYPTDTPLKESYLGPAVH